MRFWDASAIVSLILQDSPAAPTTRTDDAPICVWWGTLVEAASAIARQERTGSLTIRQVDHCLSRLAELAESWMEVPPSDELRDSALRLLRIHALRAADSLQLAAALAASDGRARSVEFVCLDTRLNQAASREGLTVIAA